MKKSIYILFVSIIALLFGLNIFMMNKTQDVKNDCQVLLSSSASAVVEHGALYTSLQNTFVSLMMRKL